MNTNSIQGTVIQRSFIARSLPNVIHIASAPLEELASEKIPLEALVQEILEVHRL